MNQKPILHISIDYRGNSQIKKELNAKLYVFSKGLYKDPFNPIVNIRFDTQDTQIESKILLELSYYDVLTYSFEKPLKTAEHFYTIIVTLASLTMQRLYDKNPNTGTENWLLISLNPLDEGDDIYNIQCSTGYNCSQANHHWELF